MMGQSMHREIIGASLIALVLLIALVIFRSVRRRRSKQEAILPNFDSGLIDDVLFDCLYVATVFVDRPLERVWAYGLGGRGRAVVGTAGMNMVIVRQGERSISIPYSSIRQLVRGGATIDRGVEKSGLIQIDWQLGEANLLTSLRIISNQEHNYRKLKEAIGV